MTDRQTDRQKYYTNIAFYMLWRAIKTITISIIHFLEILNSIFKRIIKQTGS